MVMLVFSLSAAARVHPDVIPKGSLSAAEFRSRNPHDYVMSPYAITAAGAMVIWLRGFSSTPNIDHATACWCDVIASFVMLNQVQHESDGARAGDTMLFLSSISRIHPHHCEAFMPK